MREKGSLRRSKSVDFWYFRISRSATVPGRYRRFLAGASRSAAEFRPAFGGGGEQSMPRLTRQYAREYLVWRKEHHIRCLDGPARGAPPLPPSSSSPLSSPPPPPPAPPRRRGGGSCPPVDLRAVWAFETLTRFGAGGVESGCSVAAASCFRFCFL